MTGEKDILYFLNQISEPNRTGCIAFYNDHKEKMEVAPGSFIKHQSWPGGYQDHILEALCIAEVVYEGLSKIRELPFTISEAYEGVFWHDVEKLDKYISGKNFKDENEKLKHILTLMRGYNIEISDELKNAILYVHGEGDMYSPFENIQKPLAAFVHCCDTMSARIWPDYPKK